MKIYEAAVLAIKEIERPATLTEILSKIKENNWYAFNTVDELSVLRTQIKRHSAGYKGVHKADVKFFLKEGNRYSLLKKMNILRESDLHEYTVDEGGNKVAIHSIDSTVMQNSTISESIVSPEALLSTSPEAMRTSITPAPSQVESWKKVRDQYINEIRHVLRRGQLAIFLGSGVSRSADLPTWEQLIDKMNKFMIRVFCENSAEFELSQFELSEDQMGSLAQFLDELKDSSPIINAYFLESTLGDSNLPKIIRKVLYGEENKKFTSETLVWLAKLCVFQRNYQVRAVVTFNYDDLLEQHLKQIMVKHASIFKEDDEFTSYELPIYHVHGFLPQNDTTYDNMKENLLVFSEQAYHTVYTDVYAWSNIIQLHVLKENVCLFVGLSMSDPNMRRLLDIASRRNQNKIKHYALLRRVKLGNLHESSSLGNLIETCNDDIRDSFIADYHRSREIAFEKMGVRIVWYEDHMDLPVILEKISTD